MIDVFEIDGDQRIYRKETVFQYSTEEQFTGEYWLDGKKIYTKTIVANSEAKTSVLINHNVVNIGDYRTFDYSNSYFYNSTSRHMIGNYINANAFAVPFQISPTIVEIVFGSAWAVNWNLVVTIRYTKTTN